MHGEPVGQALGKAAVVPGADRTAVHDDDAGSSAGRFDREAGAVLGNDHVRLPGRITANAVRDLE
jgi:hypothetical protein